MWENVKQTLKFFHFYYAKLLFFMFGSDEDDRGGVSDLEIKL